MKYFRFFIQYVLVPVILTPFFTSYIQGKLDKTQFEFLKKIPFDENIFVVLIMITLLFLINFLLVRLLKKTYENIIFGIKKYYDDKQYKYRFDHKDPRYAYSDYKELAAFNDDSMGYTNRFLFEVRYSNIRVSLRDNDFEVDLITGPFCGVENCKTELIEKKSKFGKYYYYSCPTCRESYTSKFSSSHMKFVFEKTLEGVWRNERHKR